MLNELSIGEKIRMPKSVIRTVSLEKLRALPCQQRNTNIPVAQKSHKSQKEAAIIYQKMLNRKLGINKDQKQNSVVPNEKNESKKMQQLKKQIAQKELAQCTFQPQTLVTDKTKRTVNQYFNDQINFNKRKNDKIEEMRSLLEIAKEKDNIFRPNAMLNRNRPTTVKQVNKVYDRLYEESKNKEKSNMISREESCETLKANSITKSKRFRGISRGSSAQKSNKNQAIKPATSQESQQIYKISINSHQQSSQMSSITSRKASIQLGGKQRADKQRNKSRENKRVDVNIYEKKDNSKNEQIYIYKLMKQMATVADKCSLPLVFTYMEMNLFFEKMNFIPKESSGNSRKLLYQIWSMLQGEIFQQVSFISVMKIVYAIMGCHNITLVNKCISNYWLTDQSFIQQKQKELKDIGRSLSYKQNILMINQKDSKTIRTSFQEFHLNRLKMGQSELIKNQPIQEFTFKPVISKPNHQLAEKYRNRILAETQKLIADRKIEFDVPDDGQIDHVGFLMLDDKRKGAVLQQKREQRQKEKRKLQDESMISHIPTERSSNRSSRNGVLTNKDRNQQLYQMGKNINQFKKDKSTDQIEEQKWKKQLTFKPNINTKQNILNTLNSNESNFVADYDKAVYRMHEGRKMRGNSQNKQEDQKNTSPLLYLNVVMEGSDSAKVPVFSNDNMHTITQKVKTMMHLEKTGDNSKLQKILKMQILPALKQMGIPNFMNQ